MATHRHFQKSTVPGSGVRLELSSSRLAAARDPEEAAPLLVGNVQRPVQIIGRFPPWFHDIKKKQLHSCDVKLSASGRQFPALLHAIIIPLRGRNVLLKLLVGAFEAIIC